MGKILGKVLNACAEFKGLHKSVCPNCGEVCHATMAKGFMNQMVDGTIRCVGSAAKMASKFNHIPLVGGAVQKGTSKLADSVVKHYEYYCFYCGHSWED